jgi:hypothetical protein
MQGRCRDLLCCCNDSCTYSASINKWQRVVACLETGALSEKPG